MSTVKIGVIGAGNIGREHITAFQASEGAEVVAVADAVPGAAEEAAKEFGIAQSFESGVELIACDEVEAVVVATPNRYHEPLTIACIGADKHVLLEKPMALDAGGARSIFRAAKDSGLVVMLGHQYRHAWWAMAMRERIAAGKLGDIYHAKCGWLRRKGIPGWGTWFTSKEQSGGGPLIDIGVHMIDITFDLLGAPTPVSVAGATFAAFGPKKKGIGEWGTPDWEGDYDVEDLATALIRCENGAVVSLDVSWAAHVDRNEVYLELFGDEGGLVYRGGKLQFLSEDGDELVTEEIEGPSKDELEKDPGRAAMTAEFLRCINKKSTPGASAWSGLTNSLVLDAIYRSSEANGEVLVDYSGVT